MIINNIDRLHIELTNKCNAGCPLCPRTGTFAGGVSDHMFNAGMHELTLEDIKKLPLDNINRINFCGNYGDPIVAKDALKIFQHCLTTSGIEVNTNGSIRNEAWWGSLGKAIARYNKENETSNYKSKVIFAIDGLRDTNHLYRVNTNFDMIIRNAKAFIAAGGEAHWQFICFEHNEHQLEEAGEFAKEIGFHRFMIKRSNRSMISSPDGVKRIRHEEDFETEKELVQPRTAIQKKTVEKFGGKIQETFKHATIKAFGKDLNEWHQGMYDALPKISCKSEERKEVYIACDGDVLPCCWWGDDHWKYKYKRENHKKPEFYSIMDGLEINLHKSNYDFNKIIERFNTRSEHTKLMWDNRCITKCNRNCGTNSKNQHKININLQTSELWYSYKRKDKININLNNIKEKSNGTMDKE